MRLRLQRIPEEHQHVDQTLGDLRADLLIAADRSAEEAGDVEPSSCSSMVPVVPVA
jgi:hypothetical protein